MNDTELNPSLCKNFVSKEWGNEVLDVILSQKITPMNYGDFLKHCTACGGNWCGMLLSGIKRLYPEVYDIIPERMGKNAWFTIIATLFLLDIKPEEGEV